MDETLIIWVLCGVAVFWLLNRLLATWAYRRLARLEYENDINRVIYGKEHQVKGRFE
jgi:hypothetical protein